MQNSVSPLAALNHIEDGGEVLVSFPGCLSSIFRLSSPRGAGIERGNSEIGFCPGMLPGEALQHFRNIVDGGGSLALL